MSNSITENNLGTDEVGFNPNSLQDNSSSQKEMVNEPATIFSESERSQTAQLISRNLEEFSSRLNKICATSDPQFVSIGRDLATVTQDVRKLTDTVHTAVGLIQDDQEGKASLKKTEALVQDVFNSLSEEKATIDNDAFKVKDLVKRIFKCDRIKEQIDRINSLFRIVRINIRIQCTARGLSDDLFEGVSNDLEHLSTTLHEVTRQVLSAISKGAKSLGKLQRSIVSHLEQIDDVFAQTQRVVSKAFFDINQLMQGTQTMIRESDTRSTKIADMVNDVVVRIQFHDSLNQRVQHIVQAFKDICMLCGEQDDDIKDQHLGTAFIIVDLQVRQLLQISKEIRLVRERIENDFISIESEVNGMSSILHDAQFREVSPQKFLTGIFSSLEQTLSMLSSLLDEGQEMIQEIESTANDTRSIAEDLFELKENIADIREETRVQAVNTIIMASALGHQGKTIEVLAKEIQTLSNQAGILADDVEAMQLEVGSTVDNLISQTSAVKANTDHKKISDEFLHVKETFSEIMSVVADITSQIEISGNHIKSTRSSLTFLGNLEYSLDDVIANLNQSKEKLKPWEGIGSSDSEEVQKLIERYSMAQERMIHMFDRVDAEEQDDDEDDVFF